MSKTFAVGTRVKLTGKFLRNTGQVTGSAGMDRWIVQACTCPNCLTGSWICTNESVDTSIYTAEELAVMPYLALRHIAVSNLQAG